ncbi:hypothetical protein GW750_04670 [bacterium]|nr:hypothetical protein [bacterium]
MIFRAVIPLKYLHLYSLARKLREAVTVSHTLYDESICVLSHKRSIEIELGYCESNSSTTNIIFGNSLSPIFSSSQI